MGEGFIGMRYQTFIKIYRASEASKKKKKLIMRIIISVLYPICSIVSLVLMIFYLQNTKFGIRVPFALLLANRVSGFGVPKRGV